MLSGSGGSNNSTSNNNKTQRNISSRKQRSSRREKYRNHVEHQHKSTGHENDFVEEHKQSNESVDYPSQGLIYSAPTVDTLGDDPHSLRFAGPATTRTTAATPQSGVGGFRHIPGVALSPSAAERRGFGTADPTPMSTASSSVSRYSTRSKKTDSSFFGEKSRSHRSRDAHSTSGTPSRRKHSKHKKYKQRSFTPKSGNAADKEFQKLEDAMGLTVRTIPVADRSAFGLQTAPLVSDLRNHPAASRNRVSPSPQHLELIHKLQGMTHIRQLVFSPSVGSSSDILYPGESLMEQQKRRKMASSRGKHGGAHSGPTSSASDGRYRSIDPVQATLSALPATPPLLSNKRYRLPWRADVGFPNPSPEEIQQKQKEINQETEWEEASPRLIVLVTSDDLGTATVDEDGQGGLPPFAGKELAAAKWQNQQHWSSKQKKLPQHPSAAAFSANALDEAGQFGGNRYSPLAPALDATYSSHMGWRPRPFHDRPPGLTYSLVSPLSLEFGIGNIEPLVCSLALYKLTPQSAESTALHGKVSEDFFFPAGDWKDKLDVAAIQGDADLTRQWLNRKHKALFSHDSWVVDPKDLYVVLQVHKVAHLDAAAAYHQTTGASDANSTPGMLNGEKLDRKSWRDQLKKQFKSGNKASTKARIQANAYRSSTAFDRFGTQFLSPVCFGVMPLYNDATSSFSDAYTWPAGQVRSEMKLYAYPAVSESQGDFIRRLTTIAFPSSVLASPTEKIKPSIPPQKQESPRISSPSRRKGIGRFISPKKKSSSSRDLQESSSNSNNNSESIRSNEKIESTPVLSAKATFFVSDLKVDFLESMLQTPPELEDNRDSASALSTHGRELPKLLVDVTGFSAIMMNPAKASSRNDNTKRSNLVRLPARPSSYIDASDYREVLFLPPRPNKQYDVDSTPSYRSLLNVLYLYPKLLRREVRTESKRKANSNAQLRYSVRVRLIERRSEVSNPDSKSRSIVLKALHNPAPWAGPSLLHSMFTKIPGETAAKGGEDSMSGIQLQDEFKLRLPSVLDGTQSLEFTLYAVELPDELDDSTSAEMNLDDSYGISANPIAEVSIPLSSSSTRDPISGVKVTTIIPNGNHRLRLGDFQFQVETRLFSSIHVSDPSIATALREFPIASEDAAVDRMEELALATNRSGLANRTSATPLPEKVPYASLFSSAAPAALVSHFHPLLYMHLCNLVNAGSRGGASSERFLEDCVDSLLEMCQRAKVAIDASSSHGEGRFEAFIKAAVDAYDEVYFHSSKKLLNTYDDEISEIVPSENSSIPNMEDLNSVEENEVDDFDGGAIRKRKKDPLRNTIDLRISRTFSALETSENGFHRTAYGATKTDRMRLEAELDTDTGHYTHLVDDDETVVTFATGYSGDVRMAEAREALERVRTTPKAVNLAAKTTLAEADEPGTQNREFFNMNIAETALAQRFRSAAKVMLAPCVPPNFFSGGNQTDDANLLPDKNMSIAQELEVEEENLRVIATAGSDVDEDESKQVEEADAISTSLAASFRSPWNCPRLRFSMRFDTAKPGGFVPSGKGDFVYESILLLWLRSGMSRVVLQSASGPELVSVVSVPSMDETSSSEPVFKFYSNLEILLPLCLKSIALRYGELTKGWKSKTRVIIDDEHMALFNSLFEMLPLLLIRDAMACMKTMGRDEALERVLKRVEHVIDFLIGLYAIFHPAHVAVLTRKFFQTLRHAETEGVELYEGEFKFEWNKENLFRVRCSRQLRLRAVEKLAVLPNFIALNYPMRFPTRELPGRAVKASWTKQYMDSEREEPLKSEDLLYDGQDMLPSSGWLAEVLTRESLSICALSCEAVVAEAMAHIETQDHKGDSHKTTPLEQRPTAALKREDLLMFQSIAIHAISCVHELLLRRHAMDKRYQKESSRERIAALFAIPIFEKSLASVRWLARMESTHRVRSLWLLCFSYVLQEAPENLLREAVSSYSHSREVQIHRFIRLLRLSSSTFQSFIDQPRYCMFPSEIDSGISPWLLQESFNTICATTIIVVEECASPTSTFPKEQKKMIQGILDLLLHILTTPQSSVTHLRAIGGAIQALERFGVAMFLEITGSSFQHWIRVILGLLNSTALSVRSIAVDFVVSLFGSTFDLYGNIDELSIIFASVLPEVAAREIALCSVSGHVHSLDDAEKAIWPLRRSFADIEDANPLDDDRVDPQLSPSLSVFCRACQAVLDGVLIEMRLQGSDCVIVGTKMKPQSIEKFTLDADEESLFEAATYFLPETAPIQRVRWLLTLKSLHKSKGQWVEAAESLITCARAISDSIPHLKNVWRPSRFPLWSDSKRSLWLSTVGEDLGIPERGNEQVMSFADKYLEPDLVDAEDGVAADNGTLPQPTIKAMCTLLTRVTKEAVVMYQKEEGMYGLAYSRLEALLVILMEILDEHGATRLQGGRGRMSGILGRRRHVEEEASLRKVIASISGDMTKLAEQMLLLEESKVSPKSGKSSTKPKGDSRQQYFVRVLLSGKKPTRFMESTTLPTYLEWNTASICRVPKAIADKAVSSVGASSDRLEEAMCAAFGKPIRNALLKDPNAPPIVFRLGHRSPSSDDDPKRVYVDIGFVQIHQADRMDSTTPHLDDATFGHLSKHFVYRKPPTATAVISSTFVEVTVANPFPCPLSRQRSLLTSEFGSS